MKSFQMKALALAVLGLAGFGFASSAFATCPFPYDQAHGGAWSAQLANQGSLAAGSPGLEIATPSACKMAAFLNSGSDPTATAAVADTSPTNEASYHFRFYIDTSTLTNLPNLTSVQIFAANSANTFPLSGNAQTAAMLRLGIAGNGTATPNLVAVYSCNVPAQNYVCLGTTPLTAGVHWIEGHLSKGVSGFANIWVDKASIASDSSPTPQIALTGDNSGWNGVDLAALGLGGASPNFRKASGGFGGATHTVGFDAFDSRRQTFIGQ